MASSMTIKSNIDSIIIRNGNKNITGPILHDVIKSILDVDVRTTGKITDHINSPSQGVISADFFTRRFYDTVGRISVDYGNRKLYRVDGTYFDWNGGVGSGTVTSVGISSTDFDFTGSSDNPITTTGSFVINVKSKAVTYNKIQDVSIGPLLLGRYSASTGVIQEISIGTGFNLDSTTGVLSASTVQPTQITLSVSNVIGTAVGASLIATTTSGHGNFIPTRIIWVSKIVTLSSGPVSNPQFSVTWSGGGLAPINAPMIADAAIDSSKWEDFLQGASPIPPSTAVNVNITVASLGYSVFKFDVHVIGFYESP